MSIKPIISKIVQKITPYTLSREDLPAKAVVIGGPHTSYWDSIMMMIAFWDADRKMNFLVKDEITKSIIGPIVKKAGGIGVNRRSKNGMVNEIAQMAKESEEFLFVLAPKGTRAKSDYWKSGFYHVAREANLPIVFGFIDAKNTRTYGWRGGMTLTGDVRKDMDVIREFYADKSGIHSKLDSVPRLKEEDNLK